MTVTMRQSRAIDELMEQTSQALVSTDYFEAERLAIRALDRAWALHDFERMARIVLPLQEARRQKRHQAADAGACFVLRSMPARTQSLEPGCYLLEPPLLGIDGRTLRDLADRKKTPVIVTVREPLTKAGKWPIVAVGTGPTMPTSFRAYVEPPQESPPTVPWFLSTNEALGDVAISRLEKSHLAAYHVDDLLHHLEALPDHEKLHQALETACRRAMKEPVPGVPRRRGIDNPYSF